MQAEPSAAPTLEQLLAGVAQYPALLERLKSVESQINLMLNNQASVKTAEAIGDGGLNAKGGGELW